MSRLLELAERCEKASAGDRELDREIFSAARTGPDWMHQSPNAQQVWSLHYTASIDAAMTLVPKGWTVANLGESDSKGWWAELRRGYRTSYDKVAMGRQFENVTPALALCAAALRALASQEQDDV